MTKHEYETAELSSGKQNTNRLDKSHGMNNNSQVEYSMGLHLLFTGDDDNVW